MSHTPSVRAYSGRFHNIYLFITERCQLRCGHCYMGARLEHGHFFETERAVATISYWRRMGARFLTFVGGEPTLHPDLARLVSHANAVGYEKVSIDTNGLLPARLQAIPPAQLHYVRISLDGATDETHDKVRGAGNFQKVIAGIRYIKALGHKVRITSTVFSFNRHEATHIATLAADLGAEVLNFHSFTPEGCGASNAHWAVSPSEWVDFCHRLQSGRFPDNIEIRYPPTWVPTDELQFLEKKGFKGCLGCSLDRLSVFPDGRCYVCSLLFDFDVNFGEMTQDGFKINTAAPRNELELFTSAAFTAESAALMGCPAERLLNVNAPDGLTSVCRLWRTSPTPE